MLALTRRIGETVILRIPPSDKEMKVEVTYVGLKGISVKLGFEAPREVNIFRKEIDGGSQPTIKREPEVTEFHRALTAGTFPELVTHSKPCCTHEEGQGLGGKCPCSCHNVDGWRKG